MSSIHQKNLNHIISILFIIFMLPIISCHTNNATKETTTIARELAEETTIPDPSIKCDTCPCDTCPEPPLPSPPPPSPPPPALPECPPPPAPPSPPPPSPPPPPKEPPCIPCMAQSPPPPRYYYTPNAPNLYVTEYNYSGGVRANLGVSVLVFVGFALLKLIILV